MTKLRGWLYFLALAIGTGLVASGLATFDPVTGMIDIAPFNLATALGLAWAAIGAPSMAVVAIVRGWGRK